MWKELDEKAKVKSSYREIALKASPIMLQAPRTIAYVIVDCLASPVIVLLFRPIMRKRPRMQKRSTLRRWLPMERISSADYTVYNLTTTVQGRQFSKSPLTHFDFLKTT